MKIAEKSRQWVLRIWIIGLAILVAIVLLHGVIRPYILKPLGFIHTNQMLQLRYKTYNNSALVHVIPTGYWIWFDGQDILLYGVPSGEVCDKGYESVIVYDIEKQKMIGHMCAKSIEQVQNFYEDKKVPYQYVFRKNPSKFDIYDLINYLVQKRIISI